MPFKKSFDACNQAGQASYCVIRSTLLSENQTELIEKARQYARADDWQDLPFTFNYRRLRSVHTAPKPNISNAMVDGSGTTLPPSEPAPPATPTIFSGVLTPPD